MRKLFRRKPASTPLDVLGPGDPHADFADDDTPDLTADEAYDTLPVNLSTTPIHDQLARELAA